MAFNTFRSRMIYFLYLYYVYCVEIDCFHHVRTRSSIKYFPKYIFLLNVMFLMYVNSHMYGAQFEALTILFTFSNYLMYWFLRNYEYESINNWNPYGTHTPSENNPRCGYHHVFASPEYATGFDIFSIAFPLHFRETFPQTSQQTNENLLEELNFGVNYDPRPVP